MQISGPFSVSVIDNTDTQSRELHLSFKPAFQRQPLAARVETVLAHMQGLQESMEQESDDAARHKECQGSTVSQCDI